MAHALVVSVALVGLAASSAQAVTISFQNGVDGYAGADNESFSYDGTFSEDVIRFDLPDMAQPAGEYAWIVFEGIVGASAIPPGSVVSSATLEGLVDNPFGSATAARLLDDVVNRPMSPGRLDDPGVAGSFYEDDPAELPSATHPGGCISTSVCDPPVPIAWNVTAIVQAWVDGAGNFGFLLLPEATNAGGLVPTDGTNVAQRPRLVVNFVPEPRGLGLLALAGLVAARLRSRRTQPRGVAAGAR